MSGLSYLHNMAILHRDIKPGNVVVNLSSEILVKIIDFGLARDASTKCDDQQNLRTICYEDAEWSFNGTRLYQPAEQVSNITMLTIEFRVDLEKKSFKNIIHLTKEYIGQIVTELL